jgi:hypothetical protein
MLVNKVFIQSSSTYLLSSSSCAANPSSLEERYWTPDTLEMMFHYCLKDRITGILLLNLKQEHIPVLNAHLQRLPNLKSICLSFNSQHIKLRDLFLTLVPIMPKIESIELKSMGVYKQIDNEAYRRLFHALDSNVIKQISLEKCYCFSSNDNELKSKFQKLEVLKLRDSLEPELIFSDVNKNIVKIASNLTVLEISYCGTIEYNNSLRELMEDCCKNLRELRIYNSSLVIPLKIDENDYDRSYNILPSLTSLSINAAITFDEAFFISDSDWNAVFSRLEHFEYIEIKASNNLVNSVGKAELYAILRQCNNLKRLRLNKIGDDRCDSSVFDFLEEDNITKRYEIVDFSEAGIDSIALDKVLKYSPNLKEIIATCPYSLHHQSRTKRDVMNFGNEFIQPDNIFSNGSLYRDNTYSNQLLKVDLSNCIISDQFLIHLLSIASKLRYLILEGTIRSEGSQSIQLPYTPVKPLTCLSVVRANGCDISMALLLIQLLNILQSTQLTWIDLSNLIRVQNSFIPSDMKELCVQLCSLLKQCAQLYCLKVTGLQFFDNACIYALREAKAPISKLYISDTIVSIEALLSLNFSKIQSLEFVGCLPISDLSSLHELLKKCNNVNKLAFDITSCGIDNTTIEFLGNECKHLTYLKIVGQPKKNQVISEDKLIDLLINKTPALRQLTAEFNPISAQKFAHVEQQISKRRFALNLLIPYPEDTSDEETSSVNSDNKWWWHSWCALQ